MRRNQTYANHTSFLVVNGFVNKYIKKKNVKKKKSRSKHAYFILRTAF